MNYRFLAILVMAFTFFCSSAFAQTLATFYYRADGKELKQIIKDYTLPSPEFTIERLEKAALQANPQLSSQAKDGRVLAIRVPLQLLNLEKLKNYYLSIEGGEFYTEELYQEERARSAYAESFTNHWNQLISYDYLPFYFSNAEGHERGQFNSMLGLTLATEYSLNQYQFPCFIAAELSYRRWSNVQSIEETTPAEKRITVSPPSTWDWSVSIGGQERMSDVKFFSEVASRTNYIPRFSAALDKSLIIKDQRIIGSVGFNWAWMQKRNYSAWLKTKIGISLQNQTTTLSGNGEQFEEDLGSSSFYELSIEPIFYWKDKLFFKYHLAIDQWYGESEITLFAHKLSIGKKF